MNIAGGRPGQKHDVNMGWTPGDLVCNVHVWHNFLDIRLFDCLFLSDSRGEEQDDRLLGETKA